jgi:hypothetical protein
LKARPIQRWLFYAAVLLLVMGLLPGASSVYPRLIHAEANGLFAAFGAGRSISFSWVEPATRVDRSDTRMQGWVAGEAKRSWRAVFSVHRRGYWPSAAFAALLLATPMSLRRRTLALLGGLVALNFFLLAQLALLGAAAFAANASGSSVWSEWLPLSQRLFNSPVPSYVLVFVLWALLARPAEGIDLGGAIRLSLRRRPPP